MVRKAALHKVPTHLVNLASFLVPLLVYVCIALASGQSLGVSWMQLVVLLAIGGLFSYGGNLASLKAIALAPNPGYSLMLSKSYVLFTTLVSVLFLHGTLGLRQAVAILFITGFSVLIMYTRKGVHKADHRWIILSFAAFFAWGLLSLSAKYLYGQGISPTAFLVYIFIVASSCILTEITLGKKDIRTGVVAHWPLLVSIGVLSALFNLGSFMAIQSAPNVGYVNAINAGSIAVVTLLAAWIFKDELTIRKGIGILGVTFGLALLLI